LEEVKVVHDEPIERAHIVRRQLVLEGDSHNTSVGHPALPSGQLLGLLAEQRGEERNAATDAERGWSEV